ncbi:hypothetical protein [Algoriphagus yeomjeoni]|uniref:Uncharacterized protein n=1 Tax=Algoriphagus yeomjeoni TaxID=291403 RepID=A0A327PCI8_9BACT|nr:hypothetical protein [Algoriphagus yeomjeoni]RAI89919.1 hypothetical protein LV83_01920 [Algoriphagus yeomjeoni]
MKSTQTMKANFFVILLTSLIVIAPLKHSQAEIQQKDKLILADWLRDYIPSQYPGVEIIDNKDWYQAVIPAVDVTISWAFLPQEQLKLKGVTGHYEGKALYVSESINDNWTTIPTMELTEGAGYFIPGYTEASMGDLEVAKLSVLQFRGTGARKFVERMQKDWLFENTPEYESSMTRWLKDYTKSEFPQNDFLQHHGWYHVEIPEYDIKLSWGQMLQDHMDLGVSEGLNENQTIFIAKEDKTDWVKNTSIQYYEGVGYYVPNYKSASMGKFDVGRLAVIHFNGANTRPFVEKMQEVYSKTPDKSELNFALWLVDYVKAKHPNNPITYHGAWYQSVFPNDELTVTWGSMSNSQMELKELHGLFKGKSIFIEQPKSQGWESIPNVNFISGVGYSIPSYDEATMGHFEVGLVAVIQYSGGKSDDFTKKMAEAWRAKKVADIPNLPFRQWLYEYIPTQYASAKMIDHKYWLQGHIGGGLVASWALFDQENVTLKDIEDHNLTEGKTIFIEKRGKNEWAKNPEVTYYDNAGYLISGYNSATMSSWNVQDCNIIQFDGEPGKFTAQMAKAWGKTH